MQLYVVCILKAHVQNILSVEYYNTTISMLQYNTLTKRGSAYAEHAHGACAYYAFGNVLRMQHMPFLQTGPSLRAEITH